MGVGVPTLLSRVVSQLAGNIEVALVSAVMGPSTAAIYGITERTFRLVQGFINPIVGSAFSGLAHLMGERGPSALLAPLRELRGLYTLVVSVTIPCILVINRDFITLWVGADKFGGTLLSAALALSSVLVTQVLFLGLVSSATGQVRSTAYLTGLEAVIRVPLIVLGLHFYGPAGMALSTSFGCALLAFLAYPAVIGKGLGLIRRKARVVGNDGLLGILACLPLSGMAARYLPVAAHWLTLVVKGGATALALLSVTVLLNEAARSQLRAVAVKVSSRLRRHP
jgi:O-antigen/teichoic acid export membrane protein